jgi:hypothetical protein
VGHSLLGSAHSDAVTGAVGRGDLIVGQGTSPTAWTRLPIGPPNRCLMSNGSDAVWNTCLYTGYSFESIPFVDASGNLSQNNTRLFWDNSNRQLGIGTNTPTSTLYLHDALAATGTTQLTIRAGQGQSTNPLQRWMNSVGTELGRIDFDGSLVAPAFNAASSSTRAGSRDTGTAIDPSNRMDGDSWFNTTQQARKNQEGGQIHTTPQVLCSSPGSSTNATSVTQLGSCSMPAGFLSSGDRIEIQAEFAHQGSSTGFSVELRWGSTVLLSRTAAPSESALALRGSTGVHASGASWTIQSWGTNLPLASGIGNATDAVFSGIAISLTGSLSASGSDTVALRNFTVIRYPAQSNP